MTVILFCLGRPWPHISVHLANRLFSEGVHAEFDMWWSYDGSKWGIGNYAEFVLLVPMSLTLCPSALRLLLLNLTSCLEWRLLQRFLPWHTSPAKKNCDRIDSVELNSH